MITIDHGEVVRREVALVIVPYDNGAITEPAVPPAVSSNGEAGRQRPVRSPLTTILNRQVDSKTVRQSCCLLASERIGSKDEWYG